MPAIQKNGLVQGIDIFLSATWLKKGRTICISKTETVNANATIKNDSVKNWATNCFFNEPTAFRMPTSFARFSERAVVRFIKLMQANNNTTNRLFQRARQTVYFPLYLSHSSILNINASGS